MFEYANKYGGDPFEAFDRWYATLTPDQELLFWAGVAAVGVLVGIAFFIYRLVVEHRARIAREKQSVARNKLAAEVGACIAAGQAPPPFCLYLRPFASTGYQVAIGAAAGLATAFAAGALQTAEPFMRSTRSFGEGNSPGSNGAGRALTVLLVILGMAIVTDFILWRSYQYLKRRKARAQSRRMAKDPRVERSEVLADFEDMLEDGVTASHNPGLIGLGNPGESIGGAGRLRVPDAEWKSCIDFMLTHSRLNILVLSTRPGTLWEVERVLSTDGWKKTLFVQPPLGGLAKGAYAPEADYDAVRKVFEKYGARIPARQRMGVAFAFEDLTRPCWSRQNLRRADLIAKACGMVGAKKLPVDRTLGEAPIPDPPLQGMPFVDART